MFAFTVYDLLRKNLENHSASPAIISGNITYTYQQLISEADALSLWLIENGVRRGDRVGIHLRKSVEEVIATFAIAKIGAVFVNINWQWTLHQLSYIINDCGIKVLFTDSRKAKELKTTDLYKKLNHIITPGKASINNKIISWPDPSRQDKYIEPIPIDNDLAALLYTSGSTGNPKGVMLSHLNIVQGARSVARYLKNNSSDRILSHLPMSFDYGMSQITTMFLVGGSVVLQAVPMPSEIVKTIAEKQVTGVALVPPSWIQIIRYLQEANIKLPSLRYVTNSGGKIPQSILEEMPKLLPDVDIYLMYGLTEAFRSAYLPPELFAKKMGAIGQAIPNNELFVVDTEKDILCKPGEQGELIHRGSLVSLGYWGQKQATDDKIKVCSALKPLIGDEKVLFSGDIVRVDEDNILWFVSRYDSMIKSSGFRISPTEIEDVIYKSGYVDDVVAFGVENDDLGQVVHVAVSAKAVDSIHEDLLIKYCQKNMPSYMIPSKIHCWQGQMPRISSGKIDRVTVVNTCYSKE